MKYHCFLKWWKNIRIESTTFHFPCNNIEPWIIDSIDFWLWKARERVRREWNVFPEKKALATLRRAQLSWSIKVFFLFHPPQLDRNRRNNKRVSDLHQKKKLNEVMSEQTNVKIASPSYRRWRFFFSSSCLTTFNSAWASRTMSRRRQYRANKRKTFIFRLTSSFISAKLVQWVKTKQKTRETSSDIH